MVPWYGKHLLSLGFPSLSRTLWRAIQAISEVVWLSKVTETKHHIPVIQSVLVKQCALHSAPSFVSCAPWLYATLSDLNHSCPDLLLFTARRDQLCFFPCRLLEAETPSFSRVQTRGPPWQAETQYGAAAAEQASLERHLGTDFWNRKVLSSCGWKTSYFKICRERLPSRTA